MPTYRECENIKALINSIVQVFDQNLDKIEVIIVDDNSMDGTDILIENLNLPWLRLIKRGGKQGLSSAVIEGLNAANFSTLIVMDADLSHNPEKIPEMVQCLNDGADFVVGSRYVEGGSTADDWGVFRWLNSRVATILSRPFTNIKDPMSGYFCLTQETFRKAKNLNPVGYKIGLELIVKCNCNNIKEIPIHFKNRLYGVSKLTLREQINFLIHIWRLWIAKYGLWTGSTKFAVVGLIGVLVNLLVITILLSFGIQPINSVAGGIGASIIFNFMLNRKISSSYGRDSKVVARFLGYIKICGVGALVNFMVCFSSLYLIKNLDPRIGALMGIFSGAAINYLVIRFLAFKRKYHRQTIL